MMFWDILWLNDRPKEFASKNWQLIFENNFSWVSYSMTIIDSIVMQDLT
jgi:hypothetical protein